MRREDPGYAEREKAARAILRKTAATAGRLVALAWRRSVQGRAWAEHYRRLHPEQGAEAAAVRRERLRANGGRHTDAEWRALCDVHGWRCVACGAAHSRRWPLQRDHVIPVALGGPSGIWNIQPLCAPCNARKGATVRDFRIVGLDSEYIQNRKEVSGVGKKKPVNVKVFTEKSEIPAERHAYELMAEVRKVDDHKAIEKARIALAWENNVSEDADNHLRLGKCCKASDLQKEFARFDFVIMLNVQVWNSEQFDDAKRKALLDHELSHAAPVLDSSGMMKQDERGRFVWRIRKHDIEEFSGVVARHGTYKYDLEEFANSLRIGQLDMLLEEHDAKEASKETILAAAAEEFGKTLKEDESVTIEVLSGKKKEQKAA